MRWIRTRDELPYEGQDVLVSYKSAIDGAPCVNIAHCEWASDFLDYSWFWADGTENKTEVTITHWMPLPEPPDN